MWCFPLHFPKFSINSTPWALLIPNCIVGLLPFSYASDYIFLRISFPLIAHNRWLEFGIWSGADLQIYLVFTHNSLF